MAVRQSPLEMLESEAKRIELEGGKIVVTAVAAEDWAHGQTQPLRLTHQGCTEVFAVEERCVEVVQLHVFE